MIRYVLFFPKLFVGDSNSDANDNNSRRHKLGVPGVSLIFIMMRRSMMFRNFRNRLKIDQDHEFRDKKMGRGLGSEGEWKTGDEETFMMYTKTMIMGYMVYRERWGLKN
jgi:hypothetical protein